MQVKLLVLMNDHHLKIIDLARILGITPRQASAKLKGKVTFRSDEMYKLCDYFNLTLDDIFLPTMYENRTK